MARDKEFRISIKIDADSEEVKLTKKEVAQLDKGFSKTSNSIGTMTKNLGLIGGALGGLYSLVSILEEIKTSGIEYNRTLENLNNGLTTLNVITSSNISSTGEYLSLQERYKLATDEAVESVRRLTQINQSTPHTLMQTVEIYKAMFPSMRKVGVTSEELYDITQKLSIAAGSAGIEFQQLLAGVDGLATGTVLSNSELGRFLNTLGLTNDELKNADDLYALINGKLKDVEALETYDNAISNLGNSFDQLAGVITEPFFEEIKEWAKDATTIFDTMTEGLKRLKLEYGDVSSLTDKNSLIMKRQLLLAERKEIKNNKFMWDSDQRKEIAAIDQELSLLSAKLADIFANEDRKGSLVPKEFDTTEIDNLVGSTLEPYAAGLDKINEKWQKNFDLLKSNGHDTSGVIKAWTKDIEDYDIKYAKKNKPKDEKEEKVYSYDAHVMEYYNQKREHEAQLLEMYKQSSMSQYDYERDALLKKYDEHKTYTESVAMLDAWYSTELQKINNKELEEYKQLQDEKRREHGSFADGATDALRTYSEQAADAYAQGEQLFTSAMQNMEDALVDFVMTGKLSFSDLLSSITRMVIQQQIMSPMASAMGSFVSGMFGATGSAAYANGGSIPIQKFMDGGLLSGGSGLRDDLYLGSASGAHVYAMGGEYIVNKEAVNSLGVNTMDYLNSNGQLPTATTVVASKTEVHLHNNTGMPMEATLLSQSTTTDKKGQALELLEIQMDLIGRNEKNSKRFFKGIMAS